jgi:hypothetical protein
MTFFLARKALYHRRAGVSRSCSGWEGVGPAGYGRQALKEEGKEGWVASFRTVN